MQRFDTNSGPLKEELVMVVVVVSFGKPGSKNSVTTNRDTPSVAQSHNTSVMT